VGLLFDDMAGSAEAGMVVHPPGSSDMADRDHMLAVGLELD
jgi:hypothetical protein